ncbi:serine protease HTRA3-like [Heterodontus francisci]|uniref:serine protease HTRA3-like n=1 Tax=Heterodontus francisci TaxID=7792 RepID=UPI00355B55E9
MASFTATLLLGFLLRTLSCGVAAGPAEPSPDQPPCSRRCDVSKCPSPSCLHGYVHDSCHCCLVCAAGEGQACGRPGHVTCGEGMECKSVHGKRLTKGPGVCRCKFNYKVCGSDAKTYDNVCKFKLVSRRALQLRLPPIVQAHKGACEAGHSHPNSPRYKFNFIADVVEKIAPAVVHIELFLRHPLLRRNIPLSSGSGFIISDSGLIVTNAHVVVSSNTVISGQQQLKVQVHDGKNYEATIKDIDKKSDIATIKINPKRKLPILSLGQSVDLRPGEFVVAIGSPFALQNTVTTGIVSSAQREGRELGLRDSDMDYIQTDAIINYGNSGGPLVNLDGEVIGINTLKVTAGISFAIPSDRIAMFLIDSHDKQTKDGTGVKKRFIGVRMLTVTPALIEELKQRNPDFPDINAGIYVHEVIPDSPAHRGGIQDGDVIVKVNGIPLKTTNDLQEAVKNEFPLLLEVRRGNDDILFNIEPDLIM